MMGSGLGGCEDVPDTCVLKMMLRYGTLPRKLRHVMMGSGLGGCVDVLDTCVLKMMLRYGTLSWGQGWAGVLTFLALAS